MSILLCTTSAGRRCSFTSTSTFTTSTTTAARTSRKRRRNCSPTPTPALTPPLSPAIHKFDDNDSSRPRKRVRVRVLVDTPATTPPTRTNTDADTDDSQPTIPPLSLPLPPSPSSPSPPASRSPLHPYLTSKIDPDDDNHVMQAYNRNITRHKRQDAALALIQKSCRVTKYGAEVANACASGSTPPHAREEYRERMMEERYTRPPTPFLPLDHVQTSYDHDNDGAQTPASDVPDSPLACVAHDQEEENWQEQSHTLDVKLIQVNASGSSNSKADLHVLSRCEGRHKLALDIDRELDQEGTAKKVI